MTTEEQSAQVGALTSDGSDEEALEDASPPPAENMRPKRRRRILIGVSVTFVVLIVITLAAVLTTDDPPNPAVYQDILTEAGINRTSSDAAVEKAMAALADQFMTACPAGISIAVTRNDTRIIVPRGVLNVEDPTRRVDQDTLFEIGSVSKPLTGLVLANQIVAGNISLDTPLNLLLPDSVPDLVVNGSLVTFRQLVTHTAGFPRVSNNLRDKGQVDLKGPNPYAGYNETDMLREITIAASELSQTGDVEYSNFGFSILGYLLERSQNASFPALQKDVTDRLGMDNTWIEIPEEARVNLSTGYLDQDAVPHWFDGGLFINGAGSTLSSTRDLLTWIELLMSPEEKLQDEDLVETLQLSLESLKPVSDDSGVSFAWFYSGEPSFWAHTGATAGFVTYVAFQPETHAGIVVMSNCFTDYGIFDLGNAIASKVFVIGEQTN